MTDPLMKQTKQELVWMVRELQKDRARLDHVIDNFELINIDGWADHADYSAMDLGPEENEQAEVRKAWRKYLDTEMEGK